MLESGKKNFGLIIHGKEKINAILYLILIAIIHRWRRRQIGLLNIRFSKSLQNLEDLMKDVRKQKSLQKLEEPL